MNDISRIVRRLPVLLALCVAAACSAEKGPPPTPPPAAATAAPGPGTSPAAAAGGAVRVDAAIPAYEKTSGISGNLSSIGSDTMNNLMTLWGEAFSRLYPNVKLQVEGKGSSTAPPALIEGTAQFGPMSRPMKSTETDQFEKKFGYKPTEVRTSFDALAVYVHRDNPIERLTLAQVDAAFSKTRKRGHPKDMATWGDLGLTGEYASRPLSLYGRNSASGTYGFFKEHVLKNGDFKDTVKEQPGSASVVQGVTNDRYAMGYSGIGYKTSGVKAVPLAETEGGAFSSGAYEDVVSGTYPLARFLYVYVNKGPGKPFDPLAREFLKLVMSREGQEVVIKDGYLPLTALIVSEERRKIESAATAETTFGGPKIRERLEAARGRIRAVRRIDRVAGVLIRLGGLGIVVSVLGILVFILSEAWPMFRPARGRMAGTLPLAAAPPAPALLPPPSAAATPPEPAPSPAGGAPSPASSPPSIVTPPGVVQAMGSDEYQMYLYAVRGLPRLEFFRLPAGTWFREFPLPALAGSVVTSAARSLQGDFVALGTADGRVALAQVQFRPRYEDQKLTDLDIEVTERGLVTLDGSGRPVRQVAYSEGGSGRKVVAALLGDDEIALWTSEDGAAGDTAVPEGTPEGAPTTLQALRLPAGERITRLALGRAERLVAGTDRGNVYHWSLVGEARLTSVSPLGESPVTALAWALGEVAFLAGTEKGEVSAWFEGRLDDDDAEARMVRAHDFAPQSSAVRALGASTRDKSFVTVGEDGSVVLRHMTSERTLLTLSGETGAIAAMITPKGDGLLVAREDGTLARYDVDNPHPEISWRTLFGKVWYEGYGRPEYVWQSTGGTNDFETKFSLVPLVFGTLKGTFYALLFAIPLAVLGALYISQFVHPDIRGRIKPTVEIMAALPSVVIGFVAGLYLAPLVERYVVAILLMMAVMPAAGTAGVLLWHRLPKAVRRFKPGMELALIVPLLLLGGWVSLSLAPGVEQAIFGGDFRMWLSTTFGLTYDQRNSLVVGLAMGFAVIPIIFTIADDAFSSVPSHLTAGSLALGASRWQTALRIVVPTASPGVFSAIMIGFGRAVGETMIVLMATGNTPVLDWSIFNGMRTLSANIAVEIPEAPYGGTLYRVLFLGAALLFTMTFAVNTLAEVVRQRLREKYRAL